jgi:hypothetical protein
MNINEDQSNRPSTETKPTASGAKADKSARVVKITTKRHPGNLPVIQVSLQHPANPSERITLKIIPEKCELNSLNETVGLYPPKWHPGIVCAAGDPDDKQILHLCFAAKESAKEAMQFVRSNMDGALPAPTHASFVRYRKGVKELAEASEWIHSTPEVTVSLHSGRGDSGLLLVHPDMGLPVLLDPQRIFFVKRLGMFVLFTYAAANIGVYVLVKSQDLLQQEALVGQLSERAPGFFAFLPSHIYFFEGANPVEQAEEEHHIRGGYGDEWPELVNAVGAYWKEFGPTIQAARSNPEIPSDSHATGAMRRAEQQVPDIILGLRSESVESSTAVFVADDKSSENDEPPLSKADDARLDELHDQMADLQSEFDAYVAALVEIKRRRLYRAEYRSFAEYCQVRWAFALLEDAALNRRPPVAAVGGQQEAAE